MLSERLLPEREILPGLEQLQFEIIEWIPTRSNGMARLVKARNRSGDLLVIKIARVTEHDALTVKHNLAIVAEAKCLQKLAQSPGVVPILPINFMPADPAGGETMTYHGTLDEEGSPTYLVQPYLSGPTLSRFVGKQPMDPFLALQLVHKLALTLDWVHDSNWVHRDLKPSNIIIDGADEPYTQIASTHEHGRKPHDIDLLAPTLIDFGIAVAKDEQVAAEGTLSWMAPEVRQAFEENRSLWASPACDLYGLGLILCYMLSGDRPDASRTSDQNRDFLLDSALSTIQELPSVKPKTGDLIGELLRGLLDKNPQNRLTAYGVRSRSLEIFKALDVPLSLTRQFDLPKKRNLKRLWRITGSLLVAFISILIGQQLFRQSQQGTTAPELASVHMDTTRVAEASDSLVTPAARFPSSEESPTATLLPAEQTSEDNSGSDGEDSVELALALQRQVSAPSEEAQLNDITGQASQPTNDEVVPMSPEASFLDWFPGVRLPSVFRNLFSLQSPQISAAPNISGRDTSTPTPFQSPTPIQTTEYVIPARFPESANVLEIIGESYTCKSSWEETDTWNKSARGSRINLRWRQVGELPFNAAARYVVAVAIDEKHLVPTMAEPISPVITGDGIDIDAVNVFWTMNRLVPPNLLVNHPYVWGVFLIDSSGKMVMRVSPVCYFQLDRELARSVSNE